MATFDPTKFGAVPVNQPAPQQGGFNPAALGAVPVKNTALPPPPAPPVTPPKPYSLKEDLKKGALGPVIRRVQDAAEKIKETSKTQGNGVLPGVDKAISQANNVTEALNEPVATAFKYTGIPYLSQKLGGVVEKGAEFLGKTDAAILRAVLPKYQEDIIRKGVTTLADPNSKINKGVQSYLDSFRPEEKNALRLVKNVAELAGNAVGAKEFIGGLPRAVGELGAAGERAATKISSVTGLDELAAQRAAKRAAETAKQVDNLTGRIIQGETKDIPKAREALSQIDTEGVKTYGDLRERFDEKIKTISEKLDATLETNPKITPLKDLQYQGHNYVDDALTQLEEYYVKTNDVNGLNRIKGVRSKAETQGLSAKELNDIAKEQGRVLDAFKANGDLSASLSKKSYENTRSGVKSTARNIFGDKAYQEADLALHNIKKTRDLVAKMEENVNKLAQKTQNPNIMQKLGMIGYKVGNFLSLGTLKGVLRAALPPNMGPNVLSAVEIEGMLSKNLRLLEELNQPGVSQATIESKLQQMIDEAEKAQKGRLLLEAPKTVVKDGVGYSRNDAPIELPPFKGGESGFNPRAVEDFGRERKAIDAQNERDAFNASREKELAAREDLKKQVINNEKRTALEQLVQRFKTKESWTNFAKGNPALVNKIKTVTNGLDPEKLWDWYKKPKASLPKPKK